MARAKTKAGTESIQRPRMGRPPSEFAKSVVMMVRMEEAMSEALHAWAEEQGKPASTLAREIIAKALVRAKRMPG